MQLAKTRNSYVIGVASGRHERFLRELGVDRFVDYTLTAADDVVLGVDAVGGPRGQRFLDVLERAGINMTPIPTWPRCEVFTARTVKGGPPACLVRAR